MNLQQALEQSPIQQAEASFDGYTTGVSVEDDGYSVWRQRDAMPPFLRQEASDFAGVERILTTQTPHTANGNEWQPNEE